LLAAAEPGIITLIGATTENPTFEVNAALLSRCQVYILKPLQNEDLLQLLQNVLEKDDILKQYHIRLQQTDALLQFSGGDARK
jgi:putative ATPase